MSTTVLRTDPKTENKQWNKTRTRLSRNPNWDYKIVAGGRLILAKE